MADVPLPKLPSPLRFLGTAGERLAKAVAIVAGLTLVLSLVALPLVVPTGALVRNQARKLGDVPPLQATLPRPPQRSVIYASDGRTVLANLFLNEDRKIATLQQVPKVAQQAVIAIEDDRFYEHHGVDLRGIARAAVEDLRGGSVSQGGSTLTQQYVKQAVIGDTSKTIERKIREAMYAVELEKRMSKDQILEAYLNQAYFGEGAYGLATAAERYFNGLPVQQLDLAHAAALAAAIKAPEKYNPTHPQQNQERRNLVLDRMQQLGYASAKDVAAAKHEKVKVKLYSRQAQQPFFVQYITHQLLTDKGYDKVLGRAGSAARKRAIFQGGLSIYTTLDPRLQGDADAATKHGFDSPALPADRPRGGPASALASVDPRTGQILAMSSSVSFARSQVNLATGQGAIGFQPGSSFKVFYLVAALEHGIPTSQAFMSPSQMTIPDRRCEGPDGPWQPANSDPAESRVYNMYEATAKSVNTYFAQLMIRTGGPAPGLDAARRMGIPVPATDAPGYGAWDVCSAVLGSKEVLPLDMASANGVLANNGKRCASYAITKIVSPDRPNRPLVQHQPDCKQVIDPQIAATVVDMLRGVVRGGGTGWRAALGDGRPLAGKTGTAQEYRSAFFNGFTPQLATSVWVGYPRGQVEMRGLFDGGNVFGGTYPALIFKSFMTAALAGQPVLNFPAAPPPPPPPATSVPNVVGQPLKVARRILRDAGYQVIAPPGAPGNALVTGQAPPGGTNLPPGSPVTLLVNGGLPGGVVVPNVVGQRAGQAAEVLQRAGFHVNLVQVPTLDPRQAGRVVGQSPGGGSVVPPGSFVTISVGRSLPVP
jgi:membrane peptidoglycan carboxypeptidase